MFNKFTNKKLTYTFIALLIIVAAVIFVDSNSKESTFDQEIVSIDTSAVSRIIIYPKLQKHQEVKLLKENGKWKVQVSSDKFKPVSAEKVKELINTAVKIQPLRLAAKNSSKWKDFQVDTSGTRVEFYEGSEKTLDIVIGKFTFQQPRNMTTFVRLTDDQNVYAVDGFLEFIFNKPVESFRNETIVKLNSDELKKITLSYKPDSSFVLERLNNNWQINGKPADSAKVADYVRTLSSLSSTDFADLIQIPDQTSASLNIETNDNKTISLSVFQYNQRYILKSSKNNDEIFIADKLLQSLFRKPADFMK